MSVEQARHFVRRTTTYQTIRVLLGIVLICYVALAWSQGVFGGAAIFLIPIFLLRQHWTEFYKKSPIKKIKGYSMSPTLENGDLLHVIPISSVNRGELRPGDIITFKNPLGTSGFGDQDLCKRIRSIDGTKADVRGDKQEDSADSRYFGPIDITDIIYKVDEVYDRYSLETKVLDARGQKSNQSAETVANQGESSQIDLLEKLDVDQLFFRGKDLIEEGEYDKAITILDKAIKRSPNEDHLYLWRGIAHEQNEDWEKAIWDIEESMKDGIASEELACISPFIAARICFKSGMSDITVSILSQMIEKNMVDPDGEISLADLHCLRGQARYRRGVQEEALSDLTTAISLGIETPDAYIARGEIYELREEANRASLDYMSADERDPGNPEIKKRIARLFINQGPTEEGIEMALELLRMDPYEVEVLEVLAKHYVSNEKFELSIEFYSRLIEIMTSLAIEEQHYRLELANHLRDRGIVYYLNDQHNEALQDARSGRDAYISVLKKPVYALWVADSFLQVGFIRSCQEECDGFLAQSELAESDGTMIYRLLGEVSFRQGDNATAVEHLNKSIGFNKENHKALRLRGEIYLDEIKFFDALSDFTRALECETTENIKSELYALRAQAKVGLKEPISAVEDCAQALHLDATNQKAKDLMEKIRSESQSGEQEDHA